MIESIFEYIKGLKATEAEPTEGASLIQSRGSILYSLLKP